VRARGTFTALLGAAIVAAVAAPTPARGAVELVTVRQGPIALQPYEVVFASRRTRRVRSPGLDGWLVRMHARLVDGRGRPLPVQDVMLHHIVYKNRERRDPVCSGTQSFYGTGEENQALVLPEGYGYRVRPRDRWTTGWMLMNHRNVPRRAYIEYRAWLETSRRLRPVVPYWARVTGCEYRTDPIFSVPGGAPGSTHMRKAALAIAHSGQIVAAGSHLHGGARALDLRRPRCGGAPLLRSRPLYGLPSHPYYSVLPVLHEPGPMATSWYADRRGVPVRRGERLQVRSLYDGERPHTRVMGIWHLYISPGARPAQRCPPLSAGRGGTLPAVPGRLEPPAVTVPLTALNSDGVAVTMLRPPGPLVSAGNAAEIELGSAGFAPRNLSVAAGADVTWRFRAAGLHDVTVASGPRGFASRWSTSGDSFSQRLTVPGEYRLFCSLHPIAMNGLVEVRAP
jgi:plastocyanin